MTDELRERLRARIELLVNRGADICQEFQSMPAGGWENGPASSCHRCGYTADVHLLRDLHIAVKFEGWR